MALYGANDGGGGGATGGAPSGKSELSKSIDKLSSQQPTSVSTSANPKDPSVYLGQQLTGRALADAEKYGMLKPGKTTDKTGTVSSVSAEYFSWDQKTKDKFLTQLSLTGRDTSSLSDGQLSQLWAAYVGQAAQYYGSNVKLTPWDILAKDMKQRSTYLNTPRSVTATSTDMRLSTAGDAQAIFLQAAKSLLGRDPTKSEIKTFQSVLNEQERANPQVTTTTSSFMGDTQTGQTSTTTGGVSTDEKNVMAMEDIKKDPEYGAFQAATNGMNWLMEMVQGG